MSQSLNVILIIFVFVLLANLSHRQPVSETQIEMPAVTTQVQDKDEVRDADGTVMNDSIH